MTAVPKSPLVERATTAVIESERTKYPMQRFVARGYAQAALSACEAEAMLAGLERARDALNTIAESTTDLEPLQISLHSIALRGLQHVETLLARLESAS